MTRKYILSIRYEGERVAVVGSPSIATVEAAIKRANLPESVAREMRSLTSVRNFTEGRVPAGGLYDHSGRAVVSVGSVDEIIPEAT